MTPQRDPATVRAVLNKLCGLGALGQAAAAKRKARA